MASPSKYGSGSGEQGVAFFNHFPRFFLRPYGEIKEEYTSEEHCLKNINVRNCEYLKRPNVALSEMAETVSSNLQQLEHLFINLPPDIVMPELRKFNDLISNFNSKSGNQTTETMLHDLLTYVITDDDDEDSDELSKDDVFDGIEMMGHIMYLIGNHYRHMRMLVRNPNEYAQKCDLPLSHEFKQKPTLTSLNNWWVQKTVSSSGGGLFSKGRKKQSSSRQLLEELGERPQETQSVQPDSPPEPTSPTYSDLKKKSRLLRAQAEEDHVTPCKDKAHTPAKAKPKPTQKEKRVLPPVSDCSSDDEPSPPPKKRKEHVSKPRCSPKPQTMSNVQQQEDIYTQLPSIQKSKKKKHK